MESNLATPNFEPKQSKSFVRKQRNVKYSIFVFIAILVVAGYLYFIKNKANFYEPKNTISEEQRAEVLKQLNSQTNNVEMSEKDREAVVKSLSGVASTKITDQQREDIFKELSK